MHNLDRKAFGFPSLTLYLLMRVMQELQERIECCIAVSSKLMNPLRKQKDVYEIQEENEMLRLGKHKTIKPESYLYVLVSLGPSVKPWTIYPASLSMI